MLSRSCAPPNCQTCLPRIWFPLAASPSSFTAGETVPALEWLTVDCFAPVLVATVFRSQDETTLQELENCLTTRLNDLGCDTLVIQHRYDGKADNVLVCGVLQVALAKEDGLVYKLDFQRGQNLGFFADMAQGRRWIRERAEGKNVLACSALPAVFPWRPGRWCGIGGEY